MSDDPEIARINALTANARSTWFALLTVLLFVGITLMGVQHIDFYGVDRATDLPLIGVNVPTRLFFYAAPVLTAAVYGYFHLYLIKLWDALADSPAQINGKPLGEAVSPWLVTDAALLVRSVWNVEDSVASRAMQWPAFVLNIALAWGFGLLVLGLLWWQAMTAREPWMTGIASVALLASIWAGAASFILMFRRMRGRTRHPSPLLHPGLSILCAAIGTALVGTVAIERTTGALGVHDRAAGQERAWRRARDARRADAGETVYRDFSLTDPQALSVTAVLGLAPIDLAGEAVVERPADWLPHAVARADFLARWCARPTTDCSGEAAPEAFEDDWAIRRAGAIQSLRKPGFNPVDPNDLRHDVFGVLAPTWAEMTKARRIAPDLRSADLRRAQLTGANLAFADMTGARLETALLEAADLRFAQLQGADLREAQLQGAHLSGAQLQRATLRGARLQGADLRWARLQRANFFGAWLQEAFLVEAQLQGADLREARLQGAILFQTQLQEADLSEAQLQEADLREARLQEADVRDAQLQEADLREARLQGADLRRARLQGADLRDAQLQEADLRRARLQGARLRGARLQGANLGEARLQGADLRRARLQKAVLGEARLQGANLSYTSLIAIKDSRVSAMQNTNLSASTNDGGALRFVDLRNARFDGRTDFRNAFLDASVDVPPFLEERAGRPCQWALARAANSGAPLTNEQFHAHWRGWLNTGPLDADRLWPIIAPEAWHDVTPVPPPAGCEWKTGPLPTWYMWGR